jgi:hypothetical protein
MPNQHSLRPPIGVKYAGCLLKTYHSPLLVTVVASLLTLGVFQPLALGKPRTQDTQNEQIEVKLIPQKKSIKAGEVLEVRVEIWNVGSHPLFIENGIYDLCVPSPLSLRLELGPLVKPQPGRGCAADCAYDDKTSFASRLASRWITLLPGHFYGTVVAMDPDTFPQLNTPGRWRLRGTYHSIGDLSSSHCVDLSSIPDHEKQIKGLPFAAWQGAVGTNTVWINVVRGGSSAPTKKSP